MREKIVGGGSLLAPQPRVKRHLNLTLACAFAVHFEAVDLELLAGKSYACRDRHFKQAAYEKARMS